MVPAEYDELRALPGVGAYTAAAVASFAYRRRHAVLDTNVRRVLARAVTRRPVPAEDPDGRRGAPGRVAAAPGPSGGRALVGGGHGAGRPGLHGPHAALRRLPDRARLRLAPGGQAPVRRPAAPGQTYAGTDRQCRGRLLAVLRHSTAPVEKAALDDVWDDTLQRERALAALIEDGLVDPLDDGRYALPS